jgi:small basic protein
LLVGVLLEARLNVNVSSSSADIRRAILAALTRCSGRCGPTRRRLRQSDLISGFVTNAIVAVILTFIGDRLSLDLSSSR